jgi:hypothetical protein
VVNDLATAEVLVRLRGAGFPEFDGAPAQRGKIADQPRFNRWSAE